MNTSNTRNVTGLHTASNNARQRGMLRLSVCGDINGVTVQIASLPAHLNGGKVPAQRELRGIIEGRSIVTACEFFATCTAPALPAALVTFTNYRPMTPLHPAVAEHYSVRRLPNDAIYAVKTSDAQPATIGPFATLEEAEKAALADLRTAPQSVTVTITEQAHPDASHTELLEYASRLRYRLTMAYPDARINVVRDDCAAHTVIASTGAVDHADVVGIIDVLNACDSWRGLPAYPAKTDNAVLVKSLQIQRARQLGYTVHAPGAGNDTWAFCIDGDYTDGFADGPSAWGGAIADMNAPRGTVAAPGEVIYPATGPSAPRALPADPDGQNDDRAHWAAHALESFAAMTGCDAQDEAIADLIGNLMHWCDRNGRDFEKELQQGRDYYRAETAPDEEEDEGDHAHGTPGKLHSCDVCSAQVAYIIGAPCGAEVCRPCFDNGAA